MSTKTAGRVLPVVRVYSATHLKRYYPKAFERALEKHREHVGEDGYTSDEMLSSLKGLFEAAGVKLADYDLGAYNRGNQLRAEFKQDGAADLEGARALAWIENNILAPLRAPYGIPKMPKDGKLPEGYTRAWTGPCHEFPNGCLHGEENPSRPITRYTKPGAVPSCPFTGVCYDEDFLEDLIKSIKEGRTLKEAFQDLADLFASMLEDEYEYQGKAESFLETADANGYEFTKEGERI